MTDKVFFFQGDCLLLPEDFPDSQICEGVSQERAQDFDNADIFEIPSSENPHNVIRVVSLPPQEPGEIIAHENCKTVPMRQVLAMMETGAIKESKKKAANILRACHIAQWRRTSRFCGSCGAENCDLAAEEPPLSYVNADFATPLPCPPPNMPRITPLPPVQRICPKCGRIEFPRICPAVIVVITDDKDKILLAHNKKFKPGVYSLIAGFNEAGESLEETVEREVLEEVNIIVKDIKYVKSQPWPFPDSLMIGFRARYESGALKPDGEEIEDAGWFNKDNLPEIPAKGSLSRWLIDEWLAGF